MVVGKELYGDCTDTPAADGLSFWSDVHAVIDNVSVRMSAQYVRFDGADFGVSWFMKPDGNEKDSKHLLCLVTLVHRV